LLARADAQVVHNLVHVVAVATRRLIDGLLTLKN
jgi:hypothetical protein